MSSIIAPIRVIALSEFKSLGEFPRFPDNRNISVDVDTVDKMVTFFVFIGFAVIQVLLAMIQGLTLIAHHMINIDFA